MPFYMKDVEFFTPIYAPSALHTHSSTDFTSIDHRPVRRGEWEENGEESRKGRRGERKERGICKSEELKEGASSDMFKGRPSRLSFSTLLSFPPLCSLFLTIPLKCPALQVMVW